MFLDQLNARLAVKKQAEAPKLSPLEKMTKAIQADADISNAKPVYKAVCGTCKGSGTIKMGNLDCPECSIKPKKK